MLSASDKHRRVTYAERGENLSPSPGKEIRIGKHNEGSPQASGLQGNIVAPEKAGNNKKGESTRVEASENMAMVVRAMKPFRMNSDALETINKRVQSAAFPGRPMSNAQRSDMLPSFTKEIGDAIASDRRTNIQTLGRAAKPHHSSASKALHVFKNQEQAEII